MIFCEILFLSVSLFMKIYLYLVSYTYETYERYIHFFLHIFVDKIFNFFHEKFTQKKRILSSVSFQFFILFFFNNNHLNFNIFPSENLARRKISKHVIPSTCVSFKILEHLPPNILNSRSLIPSIKLQKSLSRVISLSERHYQRTHNHREKPVKFNESFHFYPSRSGICNLFNSFFFSFTRSSFETVEQKSPFSFRVSRSRFLPILNAIR